MTRASELFDKIGETKLRAVITDFYDRVFGDVMIGFMFEGKSTQHLIDREYEFTAQLPRRATSSTPAGRCARRTRSRRSSAATSSAGCRSCARRCAITRSTPKSSSVWIDHTLRAARADHDATRARSARTPRSRRSPHRSPIPTARVKLGRK